MSKATILVIEDEGEIREMLRFSLERADYQVEEAETAEIALEKLQGRLPDLLLVDWMLPGISGVELIRRLRKDELTASLPAIMLTARGEESDKLKGFDSGVDDFLSKPFSPKELLARIKALLRRSGS
ncbi:MAG: response regulator, partial [Gammaproteobacteria bacterium]|nr:response regulator [Gammaproteobacteria bacterium]